MDLPESSPNVIQHTLLNIAETVLRLPALILLELWYLKRDVNIVELTDQNPLPGYLNITQVMEFIHNRHLERSASIVLGYSVLVLSFMLLLLPLRKLINVYLHALSLLLMGLAHFISIRYIEEEIYKGPEFVVLDDFVKLEKHGAYTFIAQMMISVAICFLIGVESGPGRIVLSVFTVPIVCRMSGLPLDKLKVAHNVSAACAMFLICSYVLYNTHNLVNSVYQGFKQLRSLLMIRGFGFGFVVLCRKLRLPVLLTAFWAFMFALSYYGEFTLSSSAWSTNVISAIAKTTRSPFSLLALGITIGYCSQCVVQLTQILLGAERESNSTTTGCIESLTLVFICIQAGILGMTSVGKIFMLKLVLFVVLSALLQSLCDVLSNHMLHLSANPMAKLNQHIRCITLAFILFTTPLLVVYSLMMLLPINLWLVLILSNCGMISIRVIQATVIYIVSVLEERSEEPWAGYEGIQFWCNVLKMIAELALSLLVVFYGIYVSLIQGVWNILSVIVLLFHTYFNVFRRSEDGITSIKARRDAILKMNSLKPVEANVLQELNEICVICCSQMKTGLITPCGHLFHAFCLKKWIFVKAICPLCYHDLQQHLKTSTEDTQTVDT